MRKLKLYEQFIDFEDFSEEEIFGKMNRNILLVSLGDGNYFLQKVVDEKIYLFDNHLWTNISFFGERKFKVMELDDLKDDEFINIYDRLKIYGERRLQANPSWIRLNKNELSQEMINEILKDRDSLNFLL